MAVPSSSVNGEAGIRSAVPVRTIQSPRGAKDGQIGGALAVAARHHECLRWPQERLQRPRGEDQVGSHQQQEAQQAWQSTGFVGLPGANSARLVLEGSNSPFGIIGSAIMDGKTSCMGLISQRAL